MSRSFGFDTRMLHAGHVPDPHVGARAVPIHQSTSFVFDSAEHAALLFELKEYGNIYSRISNPTNAVLEERIASLEGATGALATASGMAAQLIALMTIVEPGDELIASNQLYGGTVTQLVHTFKKLSVKVNFVDPGNLDAWAAAITPKTRALYGETIGNPRGAILDLAPLADLAHAHRLPLIVDSTFATPYLCRPIEWGASVVLHSATKFLGGHGTSIGGVITESGKFDWSNNPAVSGPSGPYHGLKFYETFGHYGYLTKARTETLRDTGACLAPFNAFLLLQGIETLSLRMERHCANALAVAQFLETHPKVAWVAYAGLKNHPDHALAQKYLGGRPGAVLSFGVKGSNPRAAGAQFIEHLELFSHLANVGDARSVVIHPASTTHQQLSDDELARGGIGADLVRLSIGLESTDDLLWDLDQGLSSIDR
jgi:O-acetylhomoserine (thiol)-lyase